MDESAWSIRRFTPGDEDAVVRVWYRSGRAAYVFLPSWQSLTFEVARQVFRDVIVPSCTIWVGVRGDRVVAFLALKDSYVERLYVDPDEQRRGWGSRLLEFAKHGSPAGLELHTHQDNQPARALFERYGFAPVKFGVSPTPESAPDVEYHWRPVR
jgi:ribosomal protein S18 acetylase RimI-like enzyme